MTATDSRPAPGEELAWVSALVQEKIIDRWEAQDTPPHLSTIRDRLTRSKEKTARLLGLYQNLLEQGDLPADDRPEQVELRLTGLVVKRDGRLQVFNRIYQSVFNRSWVVQALRDLRPYGDAIQEWLSSGRQDESRLLRGQALQEARQWAEGKSLGDDDRLFLDASQEIERREVELRFEAEREANRILTAARDEAEAEKETANQELAQTKQRTQRWAVWGTAAGVIAAVGITGAVTWATYKLKTTSIQVAALNSQAAYTNNDILQSMMLSLHAGAQYKALAPKGWPICQKSDEKTLSLCHAYDPLMVALQQTLYSPAKGLNINSFQIEGPVNSMTPDGEMIATSSDDNAVKLWRKDGTLITTIDVQSPVLSVNFSPDGKTMAIGSNDGKVKLWKLDGNITTIDAQSPVFSVNFSPDGETIATGSGDGTVKLWRKDGTLLNTLKGHNGWVLSVSWSPDGETIAIGSGDGTVKLWRKDGTLLNTLKGHNGWVLSVSWSPDGEMIATGSWDRALKMWSKDGTLLQTLDLKSPVRSVSFSPDGATIASRIDEEVKLWRKDGTSIITINGHFEIINFSPDGETMTTGSGDGTVKMWRKDGTLLQNLAGLNRSILSVSFSPDADMCSISEQCIAIVTGGIDGAVKLWGKDGTLLNILPSLEEKYNGTVWSVNFSPDGETIATGSGDGTVKLWRTDGTLLKTLEGHNYSVFSVSFSPDGETIASGSYDGTMKLWRTDGTLLKTLDLKSPVWSVGWSPDGETISTGSMDNTVRLWRKDGSLLTTLTGHTGWVRSVSWSPDGETIASGSDDDKVKLWRRDGSLITTFTGHTASVRSVSWSPDGETIASGSDDDAVRLWKRDGSPITTIDVQSPVLSVSFSPDGETIVSGSNDDKVKLWRRDGTLITTFNAQSKVLNVSLSPDGETRSSGKIKMELWDWNLDRFLAMGCYWTADYRTRANTDQSVNTLCQRPEVQSQLPSLLRIQAIETAKVGSYTAALSFLADLPPIDRTALDQQLRALASTALFQKAIQRVNFYQLIDLSEIYEDETSPTFGDALKQFQPLTESRRREGVWLLNRAKAIDPSFDLAQAQQTLERHLKVSIDSIVKRFINRGDEQAKNGNPEQALQQYRYALQIDPSQGFTPESRLQEQQAGSRE
jgi:WD40 repeat protein